jgi:hypothetical protein
MPFTLFCHSSSPEAAQRFLRERGATVTGDAHDWRAVLSSKQGLFGGKRRLELNYELAWCSPPNWPKQLGGMANYLRSFNMTDGVRRLLLLLVIPKLKFSIGVVDEPEVESDDDPRLALLSDLAEHLAALVFTPQTLLDPQLRVLAALEDEPDDKAQIPLEAADGSTLAIGSLPSDEDEDEDEPDPPTARRVALRLYALVAITARTLFDLNLQAGRTPAYGLEELRKWAAALELDGELEPQEKNLLEAESGALDQRSLINGTWGIEGAAVLAWALGLAELPAYDTQVDVDTLFEAVGLLKVGHGQRTIDDARLRSPEELGTFAMQMLAFHWRMVDFRLQPKRIDFDEVSIFGPFDLSWAKLADRDLVLQGTRIDLAPQDARQLASSISFERFRAANWLRGYEAIYSETPTDT